MIVKLTTLLFLNNWFSSSVGSRRRTIPYADQHRAVSPTQLWIPNGKTWHELRWSVSWSLQWFQHMLSWQNYNIIYEQLVPRVKISYSPYSLRGMKRKLGPCERGGGAVRPLMVTDNVYDWLRKRTKWSEFSAGKEFPAFFSEEKQPPSVAFLWDNADSYFFTVSGDGPISLFPLQASICACAWSFLFSNCCCCAEQGCPEMLKCTIYPFLRMMTQKPIKKWSIRISGLVLWQTLKCLNTTPV